MAPTFGPPLSCSVTRASFRPGRTILRSLRPRSRTCTPPRSSATQPLYSAGFRHEPSPTHAYSQASAALGTDPGVLGFPAGSPRDRGGVLAGGAPPAFGGGAEGLPH